MLSKINFILAALTLSTFLFSACEQEGCTDPTAMNYFAGATRDNGTCFYEEDFYDPEFERDTQLPGQDQPPPGGGVPGEGQPGGGGQNPPPGGGGGENPPPGGGG